MIPFPHDLEAAKETDMGAPGRLVDDPLHFAPTGPCQNLWRVLQVHQDKIDPVLLDRDDPAPDRSFVIGEFIASAPDKVWDVIVRYGDSDDPDMRTAIGTVLLEHLLQRHGSRFRPLVEQLAHRSPRFAEMCRVRSDFSDE